MEIIIIIIAAIACLIFCLDNINQGKSTIIKNQNDNYDKRQRKRDK